MEQLKVLRKRRKWTQADVASRLGIERSTYTRYEIGQSEPSFDMLQRISELFEVSIDALVVGGTVPAPSSPNGVMVPVLGDVAGGIPMTFESVSLSQNRE